MNYQKKQKESRYFVKIYNNCKEEIIKRFIQRIIIKILNKMFIQRIINHNINHIKCD